MKKSLLLFVLFMGFIPSIFAQWQSTEGIDGGTASAYVLKGTDIFAAVGTNVYKTQNNGDNWTLSSTGLQSYRVYALSVSGNNLFAATGIGVYLSTNNGGNWTLVNTGLTDITVRSLVVKGTTLFAGTQTGVFVSTNNGSNWTLSSTGLPNLSDVQSFAVNGAALFALTRKGLFVSVNDGATWTESTNGTFWTVFTNGFASKRVNSIVGDGVYVYAFTNSGIIFKSNDNGATWVNVQAFPALYTNPGSVTISGSKIYAATSGGVFFSTNSGVNWTKIIALPDIPATRVAINGSTIVVGLIDRTFISTNNGTTWAEKNTGIKEKDIYSMSSDGTNTYAISSSDVYLSVNNGANWTLTNFNKNQSNYTSDVVTTRGNVFVSSNEGIDLSTDKGITWNPVGAGIVDSFGAGYAGSITANNTNLFVVGPSSVFTSTNNGTRWTLANQGLENVDVFSLSAFGTKVFAIVDDYSNPQTIVDKLFVSTNNGGNWTSIFETTQLMTTMTTDGVNIYVGSTTGVSKSSNNGTTWTEINNGLTNSDISSLTLSGTTLFAGTYGGGVFYSKDNGNNWRPANEGLSSKFVEKLTICGNYLLGGTLRGVFRRPLSEFIAVGTKENAAEVSYTLSPNPVSNQLTINCSEALIGKSYVVKNVLGEAIKSDILTGNSTQINVSNFANGIYFLQLIGTNKTVKFVKE